MAKVLDPPTRHVLLGGLSGFGGGVLPANVVRYTKASEISKLARSVRSESTIVSLDRDFTDQLLDEVVGQGRNLAGLMLFTLTRPRVASLPALLGHFGAVHGAVKGFRWLPRKQLIAALARDDADRRFVGGIADAKASAVTLLRGDGVTLVAPFSLFPPSGDGTRPDFARLGFTDYGRTVVFGPYEADADAILNELGPRRRLARQPRGQGRSRGRQK